MSTAAAMWVDWWRPPTVSVTWVLAVAGYLAGWLLFARPRQLPRAAGPRPAVAVVVPARDEAANLPSLLGPLVAQLRAGDELVVVDDGSTDGTAEVARCFGAQVLAAPPLPEGWTGKPHACAFGAASTSAPVLVFADADVMPATDMLDRLAGRVAERPGTLVTVQPWHDMRTVAERPSLLFNLAVLMGSGAFAPGSARRRSAFGPVAACRRVDYVASGGHAHPDVRAAVVENAAMAGHFFRAEAYVGRCDDTTFRMYPGGLGEVWRGWAKSMAAGAQRSPWWAVAGFGLWVTALASGWAQSAWLYVAGALQCWWFGRRAGRIGLLGALAHPLHVAFFTVAFARSVLRRASGRTVAWKGREVLSR